MAADAFQYDRSIELTGNDDEGGRDVTGDEVIASISPSLLQCPIFVGWAWPRITKMMIWRISC